MFTKSKLNRVALAVALSVGISTSAFAQETTSGIRGNVLSESGQVVAGATVTITDTRTGAVRVMTSNEAGSFNLRGLPVGGPYSIVVNDASGTRSLNDVFLKLGETTSLNIDLESQSQIETVVVTGTLTNANYGATGPAANFDLKALENAPAINRDLKDLIKIDPRVYIDEGFNDSIQCAGANSRFNSLTVDGIRTNDNFGLNSNGYPTVRIPFSYDSIAQVAVELAPFDVQYGGFTACNINAVTKSGSNEFHGGVFFDYTNDSMRGDSLKGEDINVGGFNEKRYGFNVGGALIEDKLFFFTSYEKLEGSDLFDRGPADSNAAVKVAGFTQAMYDEILQIARDVYGYEPGALVNSLPVEDEKIMAKLDWHINDSHRASLVYNYNDGNTIRESDGDSNEFEYSNHYYNQSGEFESYVASLYSDWTDSFSTELRIGTSDFDASVVPLGGTEFGEVQISTRVGDERATVYLGADDSRHANKLKYSSDTFKLAGTYLLGDHVITGGYEYESLDVFNMFVQESEGEFRFSSIEDFRNGTPYRIIYENAAGTNNPADGAAEFTYDIHTLYLQDEYYHMDWDATFTFGVRYDWYSSDDYPVENPLIDELYGFSNRQNLDGLDLIQPRFGFNWMAADNLEVRGGFGLYSGGNPNVWVGNNYQNNGIVLKENQDNSGTSLFDKEHVGGGRPIYDIPKELYDKVAAGEGRNGGVNILDPNFEIPSEWKYALGLTYTFADDYVLMADILYSDKQDAAVIRDASRSLTSQTAPDGRPIYADNGRSQDFMLTNVDGDSGESTSVSLALSKSHDFGLDWSVAYAYTDSKDVNPMTSSVAFSNYTGVATANGENPGAYTSNYEIPHRFTLRVSYEKEFFDGYSTRFSLFGTANEGKPYSYTFDNTDDSRNPNSNYINDKFGYGVYTDSQLVYIPEENDANVIYGPDFDLAAFNQFIDHKGLSRGEIMARNSLNSSWWTKFDIKVEQEFAGFYDGHKGSAFLIIENVGNLLNDDWGVMEEVSFPRMQSIVDATINDEGKYVYNEFIQPGGESIVSDASLWEVRIGVKYSF